MAFTDNTIQQHRALTCEERALSALAVHSKLYKEDEDAFYWEVTKNNARLGDIGISTTKADGDLRIYVNKKFRRPKNWSTLPRNTYSAATLVTVVFRNCCIS